MNVFGRRRNTPYLSTHFGLHVTIDVWKVWGKMHPRDESDGFACTKRKSQSMRCKSNEKSRGTEQTKNFLLHSRGLQITHQPIICRALVAYSWHSLESNPEKISLNPWTALMSNRPFPKDGGGNKHNCSLTSTNRQVEGRMGDYLLKHDDMDPMTSVDARRKWFTTVLANA